MAELLKMVPNGKQFLTLFLKFTVIIGIHMVQEITPCAEKPTIQINCRQVQNLR
jgi:hypothetical protein